MAVMEVFQKSAIKDIDEFSLALWEQIRTSRSSDYILEWILSDDLPFEFVVKLLIKMGFSSDHAARLLMRLHKHGSIVIATADKESLLKLQQYMEFQARNNALGLDLRVRTH